jgi:hypothetical protein
MPQFRRKWFPPTSPQQNILCHHIREVYPYPESILNFPVTIVGARKRRWVDIGIPSLKVGVEYDGQKAHFNKAAVERDKIRDEELNRMGWRVIHVNKYTWKAFLENIKGIVEGSVVWDA